MPTVYIPTPMRKFNGSKSQVELNPGTLDELLLELETKCPGIKNQLFDDTGHIKRYINVFVNGDDVRSLETKEMVLKERDEVYIIPAMAGG